MEEPTMDMWRALLDFRTRHGRYWKQALNAKWLSGGDDCEPLGASLRTVRNQFGPAWLHRLRPGVLDAAADRIAHLDRLPVMCAAAHPTTGNPIFLKRGEIGYWSLPDGISIEQFNAGGEPSPQQIAAMLTGSVFGWDVPAADPLNFGPDGLPSRAAATRTNGQGGEGAE